MVSHKDFVIANFRGTCSYVKLLNGYMVRETLGNPGLAEQNNYILNGNFSGSHLDLDNINKPT